MTDTEIEQTTWEWFAHAHPHEAYQHDPERFWQFFHVACPRVTREAMESILKETEGDL